LVSKGSKIDGQKRTSQQVLFESDQKHYDRACLSEQLRETLQDNMGSQIENESWFAVYFEQSREIASHNGDG
jgi:hypothetical protein